MAPAAGEEEEPWARQPAGRQPGEAQPRLPPAARQQPQPRAPGASLLCRSRFPNRTGRPGPDTVPGARGWRAMRELPGPAGSKGQTARKPEAGPFQQRFPGRGRRPGGQAACTGSVGWDSGGLTLAQGPRTQVPPPDKAALLCASVSLEPHKVLLQATGPSVHRERAQKSGLQTDPQPGQR